MANILYGVHGIGHGHAMRALTIARAFPQHNFLFISDQNGYDVLCSEYRVLKVPISGSPAFNHTMPYSGAILSYLGTTAGNRFSRSTILKQISLFSPDAAITDYEPNIPWLARTVGIPCLSLDHQHIGLFHIPGMPLRKKPGLFLFRIAIWMQFRSIRERAVVSFYTPDDTQPSRIKVFPPLLRQPVLERTPSSDSHILAYHGYSTTKSFHEFLSALPYPVRCYGKNIDEVDGNVIYKKNSTQRFLDDLASCRYVISTAGHTLLSEALYYGKPVMAFPIRHAFEQFLNGYYLEKRGYGILNDAFRPSMKTFQEFENKVHIYKKNIQAGSFYGNEAVYKLLNSFLCAGYLPRLKSVS